MQAKAVTCLLLEVFFLISASADEIFDILYVSYQDKHYMTTLNVNEN